MILWFIFNNNQHVNIKQPIGRSMHQVLSYETAVRANSSRDSRDYITKRNCLWYILVITILTLISGKSYDNNLFILIKTLFLQNCQSLAMVGIKNKKRLLEIFWIVPTLIEIILLSQYKTTENETRQQKVLIAHIV